MMSSEHCGKRYLFLIDLFVVLHISNEDNESYILDL